MFATMKKLSLPVVVAAMSILGALAPAHAAVIDFQLKLFNPPFDAANASFNLDTSHLTVNQFTYSDGWGKTMTVNEPLQLERTWDTSSNKFYNFLDVSKYSDSGFKNLILFFYNQSQGDVNDPTYWSSSFDRGGIGYSAHLSGAVYGPITALNVTSTQSVQSVPEPNATSSLLALGAVGAGTIFWNYLKKSSKNA